MKLTPSVTEHSPAPAPSRVSVKAGAGCSGQHQVVKISKVRDTTPGALFLRQTNLAVKIIFLYIQSEFTMLQLPALGSGQSPTSVQAGG